jgi:hypothetical protein
MFECANCGKLEEELSMDEERCNYCGKSLCMECMKPAKRLAMIAQTGSQDPDLPDWWVWDRCVDCFCESIEDKYVFVLHKFYNGNEDELKDDIRQQSERDVS